MYGPGIKAAIKISVYLLVSCAIQIVNISQTRHRQEEEGADYHQDLRAEWLNVPEEERYDPIPEIFLGHNIADFIDPDVVQKLAALEKEEEMRFAAGYYEPPAPEDEETQAIREKAALVKEEQYLGVMRHRGKKRMTNIPFPRTARKVCHVVKPW